MSTLVFSTNPLHLPEDVSCPRTINVHGQLTGNSNEVIVLKQLRRAVFEDAYVCHITDGKYGKGIYDMPSFEFIESDSKSIISICHFNFTMACTAEAKNGVGRMNWLH